MWEIGSDPFLPEPACCAALPPATVNQPAQVFEQPGHPLHFVEDDQPILVIGQVKRRLRKLRPVGAGFEVEVNSIKVFCGFQRQGRLADLAWPQECDGRERGEQFP